MATPIPMPRQGQSVETCVILEWFKNKGDDVKEGEPIFSYETDKASFEHESPVSGKLLETFFDVDVDVPVLVNVAVIGEEGEDVEEFRPNISDSSVETSDSTPAEEPKEVVEEKTETSDSVAPTPAVSTPASTDGKVKISPRAKKLAVKKGLNIENIGGTGPYGRIIERDVVKASVESPMTASARAIATLEGNSIPAEGTGIGRRIRAEDIISGVPLPADISVADEVTSVKLTKVRKIIGERMMDSLLQSAQLTMNAPANASGLMAYRATVKKNMETMGVENITINDLVAFALTRVLPKFPEINALFMGDHIDQYKHVHLAIAVDTERGLLVPVVKYADLLTLNELSKAIKSVARQCIDGTISPDLLSGGTVTLSNVGMFGITSFTPVLNPPQVALLGVNTITPQPVQNKDGGYDFQPHIGLSLTIDHRAVDGAPGAKFMKALVEAIENITLTLAL